MEHINDINALIYKYIREEITEAELIRLNNWVESSPQHKSYFEDVRNVRELIAEAKDVEEEQRINLDAVWQKVKVGLEFIDIEPKPKVKVIALSWRRYIAIAASVLLITMAGIYLLQQPGRKSTIPPVSNVPIPHDAKPNTQHPLLTLDDGTTIILDSIKNGALATQGNTRVVKLSNGQISYSNEKGGMQTKVLYNTVTVPKGSDVVNLQLSDGSRVWLNVASSIRYPVSFAGDERKVFISGEAYFEVATMLQPSLKGGWVKQPFKVSVEGMEVEVLGTHFNINAYPDEEVIETTLLEGRVKVTSETEAAKADKNKRTSAILVPGQQAQLEAKTSSLKTINDADLEQAIAWKNGYFQFNDDDLQTVMRQIARWYDVVVVYPKNFSGKDTYWGKIKRDSKASEVLNVLKQNDVHFKIQGKQIMVNP